MILRIIFFLIFLTGIIPFLRSELLDPQKNVGAQWSNLCSDVGLMTVRNTGMVDINSPGKKWWLRCMVQVFSRNKGVNSQGWKTFWQKVKGNKTDGKIEINGETRVFDVNMLLKAEKKKLSYNWKAEVRALDPMILQVNFLLLFTMKNQSNSFINIETINGNKFRVNVNKSFDPIYKIKRICFPIDENEWIITFDKADKTSFSFIKPGQLNLSAQPMGKIEAEKQLNFSFSLEMISPDNRSRQ